MDNVFWYKGYYTKIEYNSEDRLIYGKIENIRDYICFHSKNADDIEKMFHDAVDEYLILKNVFDK